MKELVTVAKMVALYGQLGFTIVTPPVVMALLGYWLQTRFSLGGWVMIVCILLGLTAAASGAWRFYRRVMSSQQKNEKIETVTFNHHE